MMTEKERQLQAARNGLLDAAEAMRFAGGHIGSFCSPGDEEFSGSMFWSRTLQRHADALDTLETDLAKLVGGDDDKDTEGNQ